MNDSQTSATAYLILVEGGPPSNFSAWSPDVPGCVSVGDTVEECVQSMREAITAHIALLLADGDEIPEPTGPGVYVERQTLSA